MDCVLEGLRLISSSLLRKNDETIESLKLVTEQSAEDDENSKNAIVSLTKKPSSLMDKKKTSSFIRRQSTLMKQDENQALF